MRTKNRLLGIAATMGLMLSMSICAGASGSPFGAGMYWRIVSNSGRRSALG